MLQSEGLFRHLPVVELESRRAEARAAARGACLNTKDRSPALLNQLCASFHGAFHVIVQLHLVQDGGARSVHDMVAHESKAC